MSIDFDSLAAGTLITTQFPSATFSTDASSGNWVHPFSGAFSPPNILCTGPASGGIDCLRDTYIDFTLPVNSLSFWAIEPNASGVVATFHIFESGVHTGTETLLGLGGAGNKMVDLTAYSNVTRLEILGPLDPAGSGIGWDSFRFDTVPAPSTAALLALAGVMTRRRR